MNSPSVEIDEAAGIQTRASRKASGPGTLGVEHRRRRGKRMGMWAHADSSSTPMCGAHIEDFAVIRAFHEVARGSQDEHYQIEDNLAVHNPSILARAATGGGTQKKPPRRRIRSPSPSSPDSSAFDSSAGSDGPPGDFVSASAPPLRSRKSSKSSTSLPDSD
jgi:hypothetical protein